MLALLKRLIARVLALMASGFSSSLGQSKHPVFGGLLEDAACETNQNQEEVPKVMIALAQALREHEGTRTEGIFRACGRKEDILSLRKQFEGGDFTVTGNQDPHVLAGLMKEWLRELKNSVIPAEVYDQCIEIAKRDSNDNPTYARALFLQLPKISQNVLTELVRLVSEINTNVKDTRMPISNMAVVFAPTLLRAPNDDLQTQLLNNKYEAIFIGTLFQAVAEQTKSH